MKKKLLIIDDEKALCKLIKINLERTGEFEVATAYSGQEGVEKAKQTKFDLVITDFKMPDIDGDQVLDALKQMSPPLPVVLFSIYYDDAYSITTPMKDKADGLVGKPIEHNKLYETIKEVLAKHEKKNKSV